MARYVCLLLFALLTILATQAMAAVHDCRMQVEMRTQNRRAGCTSSSAAAFASPSALSSPLWNINPANVCANFGTKTSLLCAHFAFKPSHGLRCRAAVIRGIGMTASPSAADVMRGDEQDRIFRRVGTTSGDSTQESSGDVVKIVSYNVLGPKQALTDKHMKDPPIDLEEVVGGT